MPASFTHQCFGDDVMHISPYKQFIQQHQEKRPEVTSPEQGHSAV